MNKINVKNNVVYLFLLSMVGMIYMEVAGAVPAFARKGKISCSTCHSAWPALNAFGRQYKEHGYRLGHLEAPNKTISEDLKWDEVLPISVLLVARPYDKKDSGEAKNRALHEVELMVAGPMGEKMSGFIELEAEDEENFESGVHSAALTYNHDEAAHIQFSWGNITWFDPYNSYNDHMRMTRGRNSVVDNEFGGADNAGTIRHARQNVAVYGRPSPNLFYAIGFSGDAKDSEGEEGSSVVARVAFDVMPSLSIGALAISGTCDQRGDPGDPCELSDRDYSRNALDVQAEISNWSINSVYMQATDDNATGTAEEENNAFYLQALYTVRQNGRPTWAPLIRFDRYEKNDGQDEINEVTASLNYYFTENIRGMLEYWDRDGDGTTADDDRVTLQLYAAF